MPQFNPLDISLNKFISSTGYCSRREADALIAAGRVYLNDKVADTGNRYTPGDEVYVDGVRMKAQPKEKRIVMAFNKPEGITTTTDTNIRDNIIDYINYPKRIFPIGRLDKDSEGLIFLTNDGDIVNKILRAGNKHEKEYAVQVHKPFDVAFLRKMTSGVVIDGKQTLPCKIKQTGKQSFNIILVQGMNRQIRKMCEALGYKVTRLQRIRIMHVQLGDIRVGKWRLLSEPEMSALNNAVEGSSAAAAKKTLPHFSDSENQKAPIKKVGQPAKSFVGNNPKKGRIEGRNEKKRFVGDNTNEGKKDSRKSKKQFVGDNTNEGRKKGTKMFVGDKANEGRTRFSKTSSTKQGVEKTGPKKPSAETRSSSKNSVENKKKSAKPGSFKTYRIRGRKN